MSFKALLKIGGSLVNDPTSFKNLCNHLEKLYSLHPFIIIPGGGLFADNVRLIDKEFNLKAEHSHFMAILSMNLIGYLLHTQLTKSLLVSNIEKLNYSKWKAENDLMIPIFLPFKYLLNNDILPHSWEITSDSIAYFIAQELKINKIILVKNVDGLFDKDPNKFSNAKFISQISADELLKMSGTSCIDKYLPILIKKYKTSCFLVSGLYPSRITKIIENKKAKFSLIF